MAGNSIENITKRKGDIYSVKISMSQNLEGLPIYNDKITRIEFDTLSKLYEVLKVTPEDILKYVPDGISKQDSSDER